MVFHALEDLEAPIQEFVEELLEKPDGWEGIKGQDGQNHIYKVVELREFEPLG
jgi:hypothetical protein